MTNQFAELGIKDNLLTVLDSVNFTTPTEIQKKAIPILLSGTQDFIGLAQTGTGKTLAFGLPLLQLVPPTAKSAQALIVCPTRELCMQIVRDIELFKKQSLLNVVAVYGGTSINEQIKSISRGVSIVVATPGRLIDLIERKAIDLKQIVYTVLDEADEMLNMGFREDIEFILKNTPNKKSVWLFSATMPPEVKQVSKRFMNNPTEITIGKVNAANKNIDHQYYICAAHQRYPTLKRIIDFNPGIYGIIFTRTKRDAQDVTEKLTRDGYDIDALHGDLSQSQRDRVMKQFREKNLQLLIATDVAARGIDVQGITHVINYELPDDVEVYTHRSGRTARAGNNGICISILHGREAFKLKQIERMIQQHFNKLDIPHGKDVCRKQFFYFIDKLIQTDASHGVYETYMPILEEKFEHIGKEEVLKKMAAMEFDRFLKYYENAEDLNVRNLPPRSAEGLKYPMNSSAYEASRTTTERVRFSSNGNFTRLQINLGTRDGFYKASFLQFVLDMSNLKKEVLGKIDLRDMNSFVEIDRPSAQKMIEAIDGKAYKGRKIKMVEAPLR